MYSTLNKVRTAYFKNFLNKDDRTKGIQIILPVLKKGRKNTQGHEASFKNPTRENRIRAKKKGINGLIECTYIFYDD